MDRLTPAARKVLEAWTVAGIAPAYHRQAQEALRREWPVLYRALVELERESRGAPAGQ